MHRCGLTAETQIDCRYTRSGLLHDGMEAPAQAGCAVQPNFFEVETCPEEVGGGFRPPDGVRRAGILTPIASLSVLKSFRRPFAVSLILARHGVVGAQVHGRHELQG